MKTNPTPKWVKLIFSALLFFVIAMPAQARPTISYRYLTSDLTGWRIAYTINYQSNDNERAACTFLYGMTFFETCLISVAVRTENGDHIMLPSPLRSNTFDFTNNRSPTYADIYPYFRSASVYFPYSGTISVPFDKGAPNCVLLLARAGDWIDYSYWINQCSESTVPVPPPPPKPVKCEFSAVGDSTIDHGSLADTALNGAQASTQINIRCTNTDNNPTTLVVRSTGGDGWGVINLREKSGSNDVYTQITVDGKDASRGTTVKVDRANFTIDVRSNLITYGTTPPVPGPFSGSTVITISPP